MSQLNTDVSSFCLHPSALDSGGPDDGITVTDITDVAGPAAAAGVLGSVLGVYERHGYDAGYRRAVQDVLRSLLGVTEQFLRERRPGGADAAPGGATPTASGATPTAADAEDLRRIVWALREDLERRFERANASSQFVEGGLGI